MATPRMRRWTDPRDGSDWEIVFAPGVEEDPPAVRHTREGLVFRGPAGELRAPSPYGSDLEDLTESDLQGLLDQAKEERERDRLSAGWGSAPSERGTSGATGEEAAD